MANIRQKLTKARNAFIKAQIAEQECFEAIVETYGSDILDKTADSAINADNVSDMVSCFLNYDEGSVDEILQALKEAGESDE